MVDTEEIEIGTLGGAGSKVPWWELFDFRALDRIADVLGQGARKYARDNWRAVPMEEHIRHSVRHLFQSMEQSQQYTWRDHDKEIEELAHGACRAIMALAVALQDEDTARHVPKGLNVSVPVEEDIPF